MKRTGLAICDELRLTTRVLPILIPKSRREDIDHILALCKEWSVALILIGCPVMPQSGDESVMSRRSRGFYEAMRERQTGIKIELVDEHLSSAEAAKRVGHLGQSIDGESACILIEDYIHQNRGSENGQI